MSVINEILLQF